jgi:hypothetical protein
MIFYLVVVFFGIWSLEFGAWEVVEQSRTHWNLEYGAWNLVIGMWCLFPGL